MNICNAFYERYNAIQNPHEVEDEEPDDVAVNNAAAEDGEAVDDDTLTTSLRDIYSSAMQQFSLEQIEQQMLGLTSNTRIVCFEATSGVFV